MNEKNYLDNAISNLLNAIPSPHWDEEIKAILRETHGVQPDKPPIKFTEKGTALEDKIFSLFYRLAKFEDFKSLETIDSKIDMVGMKQAAHSSSSSNYQNKIDEMRAKQAPYKQNLISEHPSTNSLKKMVNEYADLSELAYSDNKLQEEALTQELNARIAKIYVPTHERVFEVQNYVDFAESTFDTALEMAVTAYTAQKINQTDLAWSALTKGYELFGQLAGLSTRIHKSKGLVHQKKGPLIKKRDNQFIKDLLTRYLLEESEKIKQGKKNKPKFRSMKAAQDDMKDKLSKYAVSLHRSLGKILKKPTKDDAHYGQERNEDTDSYRILISVENWLKVEPDMKAAYEQYLDLVMSHSHDMTEALDKFEITPDHIKTFQHQLQSVLAMTELSACESEQCDLRAKREDAKLRARQLLKDPLFSAFETYQKDQKRKVQSQYESATVRTEDGEWKPYHRGKSD
ncbi:MAG: hypothetical protein RI556_06945 [Hydrogenovibrio sp.]|uniref:hypothetical protein n=1 Tax=Hydrogenovibrio sp. TaxID=2065821 RepID=UPI00287032F3|nr:hypothetical protein [Hydrogenovibrio sp.]MDR9498894.1 hypothetical protein [Hydrogenovibrio sp.]